MINNSWSPTGPIASGNHWHDQHKIYRLCSEYYSEFLASMPQEATVHLQLVAITALVLQFGIFILEVLVTYYPGIHQREVSNTLSLHPFKISITGTAMLVIGVIISS